MAPSDTEISTNVPAHTMAKAAWRHALQNNNEH